MPEKHHYIPVFYQKRWAGPDGKVCVYAHPHNAIVHKRRNPEYVGFEYDLYAVKSADPETATHLEHQFFMEGDNTAARVLTKFELDPGFQMDVEARSGWSRFIMSLIHRAPDEVAKFSKSVSDMVDQTNSEIEAEFEKRRNGDHVETFEEFKARTNPEYISRMTAILLQSVMDSSTVGTHLNKMRWSILKTPSSYPFLTSDRPIIMTNGLTKPEDHLALPIGPRRLFVASNSRSIVDVLKARNSDELVRFVNDRVVKQARRFVIGIDEHQLQFIQNRFGARLPSSPTDTIKVPAASDA